jgi:hypothetical protein
MLKRIVCVVLLSLLVASVASAHVLYPGEDPNNPRPRPPRLRPLDPTFPPDVVLPDKEPWRNPLLPPLLDPPPDALVGKAFPRLLIVENPSATSARLVLPANPTAALKTAKAPIARAAGFPLFGVALLAGLVGGGLWLIRKPTARYLLIAVLPLGAVILGSVALAQPANPPRQVMETVKVRISRATVGSDYQLILPRRPVK